MLFAALFEARVPAKRAAVAERLLSMPLIADQQWAAGEGAAQMAAFTLEEVAKHASERDCWVAIHGRVYDVTDFLSIHPGGRALLLQYKGAVADEGFDASHEPGVLASSLPPSALKGHLALEVDVERGNPNQGALAEAASATQPLQATGGGSVTPEQA